MDLENYSIPFFSTLRGKGAEDANMREAFGMVVRD